MSSREIVKLLRRCMFSDTLLKMAADKIEELESEITRQQGEIERLKKTEIEIDDFCRRLCRMRMLNGNVIASYEDLQNYIQEEKSEAVREFVDRLKEKISDYCNIVSDEGEYVGYDCADVIDCIDNLVKEMVGEENDR